MNSKTRKRIWPVSLVMALALIGVMALVVLATNTGEAQAQGLCDTASGATLEALIEAGVCQDTTTDDGETDDAGLCDTATGATLDALIESGVCPGGMVTAGDNVDSSSTTASAGPELKLTIANVGTNGLPVGSSIVLYLEDQFQAPDSIPMSSAYFVATGGDTSTTGNGSRVYVTSPVKLKTDGYFDQDKKDISIRVLIPDMCTDATNACEGPNGVQAGQKLQLVLESDSGIKNPSEADGAVEVGYAILGPTDGIPGRGEFVSSREAADDSLGALKIYAKITLSDVDNKRGYEMTVTGTGFNNGTTASVYVLANAKSIMQAWWDDLDCGEMKEAMGYMASDTSAEAVQYCGFFNPSGSDPMISDAAAQYVVNMHKCRIIVEQGTGVGDALVGSDDKANVTFEVTAPTFQPGNVNYICMADGEGRMSNRDVEDFKLEPSIKVVPASANSGDTVNVFAQDYPKSAGSFELLKIAGRDITNTVTSSRAIANDGSGEATFEVPGGFEGVLRIDAQWGTGDTKVSKDSKITLAGAQLNVSKTEALPNETLTITGSGFGSQSCIPVADIKLEDVPVVVDDDSTANSGDCSGMIEVSNSGQFVATIILWEDDPDSNTNPVLIPGTHELSVEDDKKFSASANITIAEPTVMVTPDIAGPRDYITITGENWAVDNPDSDESPSITVRVANGKMYTVTPDAVGRITQEHRVHRNVAIPSTIQVKATYGDVVKIGSFAVPASTITVTPSEGQPGDTVTLSASNMKVYTAVDYVEIGGTRQDNPGVNTDRDGNVTVENALIPGLDPGVYSVVLSVGGIKDRTIAIGEVTVLAESSARGAPAMLPGATESLGDSLVAIFHFDDVGKEWSFYDPRPEFADLNTLTEMVNGEAYWILVSETVDDVVLNNKVRSLTCRGSDCWNLEVW